MRGSAISDDNVWHSGDRAARLIFLQRLRRADPVRARELLRQTWKEERPEDRAAFVGVFETGLSLLDEEFLELALDNKRKEVRRNAAGLLMRLPDSNLVRRMTDRVRPLLKFIPSETGSVLS